ncbi:cAMP-dependent protein kinase type I-alpha regulatory subunit [Trichinella pseudospiralis]|uniref:cAMP-dependent protein kinase type I-alpha regulatory subunit n=1 Tax=Trichinella pseudospiralis TaxID=6337 RepID=A0A0V1JFZ1_TRIPS|nr:cAMP-dependent protein kinase type I-alpha regulatory subunit [Trichinella pseudospiralis]
MLPFSIMSSIFGKGNDDGLVMSHQSAWARLCEDYLERHNVSDLIKRALVRLCIAQPDDPVAFLSHYFQLLEKGEDLSLHASLVRRTILLKNGFPEGEPLRKWFRHVSRSDALFEKSSNSVSNSGNSLSFLSFIFSFSNSNNDGIALIGVI